MNPPAERPTRTSPRTPLGSHDLIVYLRRHGITVHDAAQVPRHQLVTFTTFVVSLEGHLAEFDSARALLRKLPGVLDVRFSDQTPTILYVRTAPLAREGPPHATHDSH